MYTDIEYYFKKAISYLGFGKYILLHVFVPTFDILIKKNKNDIWISFTLWVWNLSMLKINTII